MYISLGSNTAYIIIDCTKSGPGCRTLFIGILYHNTVLPLVWRTVQGSKGHVTSKIKKNLLKELYPMFKEHRDVVVLGDAEFSNNTEIPLILKVGWGFIFRFQSSYHVKLTENGPWKSARDVADDLNLKPGEVHHIKVAFTKKHKIEKVYIILVWEKDY